MTRLFSVGPPVWVVHEGRAKSGRAGRRAPVATAFGVDPPPRAGPVTVAIWILSLPLIAEFVFAPINLWIGRTMDNYTRFTGLPPWFATHVLAPVKLAAAALLAAGLAVRALSIAGAALALAVSCFYLARLVHPGRRDRAGLAGFAIFGALASALLVLRVVA